MNIKILSADYNGKFYRIHKIFGFLLEYDVLEKVEVELPSTIRILCNQIENPYLLKPVLESKKVNYSSSTPFYTAFLAKLFTILCLRSFLFVRLLSYFRFPIFRTTEEAIFFYRKLYPRDQQNLCLPRALFVACTSKSFKKVGALFIGVFLPSRAMHAWIIEGNKQPDFFDDIWICYKPVAVMYKN